MTKDQGPRSKDGNKLSNGKRIPIDNARVAALRMLARRELSESQIRHRLARRGYDANAIDAAVERLKSDGAIDDARVASAIARSETSLKRRGRLRVAQALARAGIDRATARRALDETFDDVDDEALLNAALDKRLRDQRSIADDREFQRLYRYLAAQGFEPDRILAVLTARRRHRQRD
jgi:regulatory protein